MCKCYICDAEITDKEIQYNTDYQSFDPCPTCLEIAYDAAYSDGFSHDEETPVVLDSSYDESSDDTISPNMKYYDDE